ncbi:hypothetical protein [Haloarcula marismortui]|jgi:hypothetical protein|uniref:ASCH domain-containing protein n=1 Tax=Haloarcula marismortui ATCC 33799 TaxID=662475 RepID=M0JLV4_9EURY|nr:hypothetical protein [Haloarcula californiae]EMA09981.1 hypothetical protein C435_20990 [Haloarcula californiae ATCC 33799]
MPQSSPGGTVGPIIFSDDTARSQLREHGEVVTFRKSARTTGETWWRKSRLGTKEGDVTVEEIGVVDPTEVSALAPYQPLSGFASVEAWQQAIAALNGSLPKQGRLYRVETRD